MRDVHASWGIGSRFGSIFDVYPRCPRCWCLVLHTLLTASLFHQHYRFIDKSIFLETLQNDSEEV
jgi:hypothetical protein